MKKRVLSLVLALVMVLGLAACGGGDAAAGCTKETAKAGACRLGNEPHPQGFSLRM